LLLRLLQDFSQHFDTGLIEMFHRAKNDYTVLSTYVADIVQNDSNPSNVPQLCMVEMSNTWRNWGTKFCEHLVRPKLTNVAWGAGLSFNKCHAELNVPYDPFLPNVFNGEELSRGIRFFTHGYDMYTPDQVLVTHDYHGHQSNPNVHTWGHHKGTSSLRGVGVGAAGEQVDASSDMSIFMNDIQQTSPLVEPTGTQRLNILMGIVKDTIAFDKIATSRYGLGERRTLQDAVDFSGFDPVKRKMTKNTCGNLAWVPYAEVEHYGLDKNLRRPLWNEAGGSKVKATKQSEEWSRKEKDAWKIEKPKSWAGSGSAERKLFLAEVAVKNEKTGILLLLSVVVFAAIGMVVGRQKVYAACKPTKNARLVV
jgi:hypothetical protein